MTKTLIAAVAALSFTSAAQAGELGLGLYTAGEATLEYNVDTEIVTAEVEPVIGYLLPTVDVALEVSTVLSIYNNGFVDETFETLPTLDFRAARDMGYGFEVYGEVSYDLEAEDRSDIVIGTTFSF